MNKSSGTLVAVALSSAVLVAACSSHEALVKGKLDDLRHRPAKTGPVQVPTYTQKCRTTTQTRTTTTFVNGKTRTSTKVVPVTKCNRTKSGVKTVTQVIRPEKWCIELDNVNGKKNADDRWYSVKSSDYATARDFNEGDVIRFPYLSKGC